MRRRPRSRVSTTREGASGFMTLHGELDITSVEEIETAFDTLLHDRVERIVVDFADASFVDSKAIEALMRGARRAGEARVGVAAAEAGESLMRVFDVCGLDRAMPICATREDALAATGASGADTH